MIRSHSKPASKKGLKARKGFTLIELIIDSFVIVVIFGVIIGSFLMMIRATQSGKIRTLASALANEQMEYLRNLPYDSLATQNGTILPKGSIPDTQTVVRDDISFTLTTTIIFVDDAFDGCAIPVGGGVYSCTDGTTSNTQDVVPVDYKRMNVEAFRVGTPNVLIKLSSNAAAKAAETPTNTGIILVKVIDAQGLPVESATVDITNTDNGTVIQGLTNNQGYIFVANLPPDNQNGYHIKTVKAGYSTDFTTSRTSQNPNQTQPDVDVNIQQVTIQTLVIDKLASMTVSLVDADSNPLPLGTLSVTATSTKITAINPETPKNIYTELVAGDTATFTDIEWDSYTLTVPSGFYVVNTSPYQPVPVNPEDSQSTTLVITTDSSWPQLDSVTPTSGTSGSTIEITLEGDDFDGSSTVTLIKSGQADINPTVTDVDPNGKTITATFSLVGAASGNWDIAINSLGKTITQIGGFIIP